MTSELLQGFYLGELLVEPVRGLVTGRAGARHLPQKAVEVLLCLAHSPGDLVTREDLLEQVWGADQGSQEALNHAVSEIRHSLDDHANNPIFIQTLPKRGYRLLVSPELVIDTASSVVLGAKDGARFTDIGFLQNLQRRGVLETTVAYLVVAWLLIQIADIVFDKLFLPDWAGTFVTVLVIAGFPIALVLSWYLEFRDGRAVLDEESPADARKRRFSRTYMSVIAALAIAGLMVYGYDQSIGLPEAPRDTFATTVEAQLPPIVENSFAVLPFLNIDGSEETQIFSNGLHEDVINRLSRIPGLRVSARGDSSTLSPNTPSQKVRERLRVQMYLEGSVEMAGNAMRITVQMIDSASGFHVLSRAFNRERKQFFEVRDQITSLTVANVRVALPPDLRGLPLPEVEDPSVDVYLLYRRGIDASRQPQSIDTITTALGWFDAALAVDPQYAAAHAGKCTVLVSGYIEVDDAAYMSRAESECAKALALNPNLDIVHTALGSLYRSTGRHADAEAAYQKALSIDPSNVEALTDLGDTYLRLNRPDKAEASLRKAVDIHPGNYSAYNKLGTFLYRSGRYIEAKAQYQYVVALQPEDMNGYANLASACMLMGDFSEAKLAFQKAIEIEPTKNAYSNLGLMHYFLGDFDAAIDNHSNAVKLQPNDYLARSNLGDALWVAGREADALREFAAAEAMALSAFRVNPNDPFIMMDLAWIQAMLGKQHEARQLMDQARRLAPNDPYTHYYDALVYLRAGDEDAALAALQIATDKGYSREMLAAEPHLVPINDDPRFSVIINSR